MKPVICSANQKGGVGKTLVIGLLAEYFALVRFKKVLLIDLDMQCNSSDQWVGMELAPKVIGGQLPPRHPDYNPEYDVNERSTIADIFYGKSVLPHSTWINGQDEAKGLVDVLCGHPQLLEEVNIEFDRASGQIDQRVHNRIREFIEDPAVQESYDIILLDTGPSRSPIFRAAIRAASHVVIPFRPEEKDIQGITAMLQVTRQENYSRNNQQERLSLMGLLPNMVRHTKLHDTNLTDFLKNHQKITFPKDAWLGHLTAFPERDTKDSRPKSIFELPDNATAKLQATHMAEFINHSLGDL